MDRTGTTTDAPGRWARAAAGCRVMEEPVEQLSNRGRIAEQLAPIIDQSVTPR
jgi:hypothetical protein